MRWLLLVVVAAACTADNPAFDLGSTGANTSGPDAGESESTSGVEPAEGSSGAAATCGPFEGERSVALTVDGGEHCGQLFFAVGAIELVTTDELHLRCGTDPDSQCPPGSLAVLKNGWGFPPELVAD